MEKREVLISTGRAVRRQEVLVIGRFGVHRELPSDVEKRQKEKGALTKSGQQLWVVTFLPSGLSIIRGLRKMAAIEAAEACEMCCSTPYTDEDGKEWASYPIFPALEEIKHIPTWGVSEEDEDEVFFFLDFLYLKLEQYREANQAHRAALDRIHDEWRETSQNATS